MLNVAYNLLLNIGNFVAGMQIAQQHSRMLQDTIERLSESANRNIGGFSSSSLDSFYRMEQAANRVHGSFNALKGSMRELFEIGVQSQTLDSTISFMAKNIHAEVGDINVALTELTASGQRSILGAKEALKSALSLNIPLDTAVASIKAFSNALTAAGKSQDTVVAIFDSIRTMQSQRLDEYGITKNVDQAINDEIRYLQQIKMTGQYVEEYARILNRFNSAGEIRKENLRQEEIQQLAVNNLAREALRLQTSYGAVLEVSQRARTSERRENDYQADVEALGIAVVKMNDLLKARKKLQEENIGLTDKEANALVARETFYKEDELTKLQQERNKKAGIKGDTSELYFAGSGDKHKPNENFLLAQLIQNANIPQEAIDELREKIKEGRLIKKDFEEFTSQYKINTNILQENVFAGVNTSSMDNVKNKIDVMKSSIMQLKSDVGGEILKIFAGPIAAISDLVNWFSVLSNTAKKNIAIVIVTLTGLVGALSTVLSTIFLFRAAAPIFEMILASVRALASGFVLLQGAIHLTAMTTWTLLAGLSNLAPAITIFVNLFSGLAASIVAVPIIIGAAAASIITLSAVVIGAAASIYSIVEALREYKKLSEGGPEGQKGTFWETMKAAIKEVNDAFSGIKASFTTLLRAFTGGDDELKNFGASAIKKLADIFSYLSGIFEKVTAFVAVYVKTIKKILDDPATQAYFKNIGSMAMWVLNLFGLVIEKILKLTLTFYDAAGGLLEYVTIFGFGNFVGASRKAFHEMKKEYEKISKELAENKKKQIKEDDEERNKVERKNKYEKDKKTVETLTTKKELTQEERVELESTKKRVLEYESSTDYKVNKTGSSVIEPEKLEEAKAKVRKSISLFEELKKLSQYEAVTQDDYLEIRKDIFRKNLEDYRKMIGLGFETGGDEGMKEVAEYRLKAINGAIEIFNLTLDKHKKINESAKKLSSSNKELLDILTSYFYDNKIAAAKIYDIQFSTILEKSKSLELAQNNILSARKDVDFAKAEALDAAQRLLNDPSKDRFEELKSNFESAAKNVEILQGKLAISRESFKNLIREFEQEKKKQDVDNNLKRNQLDILGSESRLGANIVTSYIDQIGILIDQLRLQSKNGEDLLLEATNQFSGVYSKIFAKINSVVSENYIGIEQTLTSYQIMSKNVEDSLRKIEDTRKRVQDHYTVASDEYDRLQKQLATVSQARVAAESSSDKERINRLDKERLDINQRLEVIGRNQKESAISLAMVDAQRNALLKAQLDIAKEKEALVQKEINQKMKLFELEDKILEAQIKNLRNSGNLQEADKLSDIRKSKFFEIDKILTDRLDEQSIKLRRNSDIIAKNVANAYSVNDGGMNIVGRWVKAEEESSKKNTAFSRGLGELSDIKIVNPQNVYIDGTSLKDFIQSWLKEKGLKADHDNRTYRELTQEESIFFEKAFKYARFGVTDSPKTAVDALSRATNMQENSFKARFNEYNSKSGLKSFISDLAQNKDNQDVLRYVTEASNKFGVDSRFILSVMASETGGLETGKRRTAKSAAGALGYMQLMPLHSQRLEKYLGHSYRGESDFFDTKANIFTGVDYLKELITNIKKSNPGISQEEIYRRAARDYNGGPGHGDKISDAVRYGGEVVASMRALTQALIKVAPSINSNSEASVNKDVNSFLKKDFPVTSEVSNSKTVLHAGRHIDHHGVDIATPTGTNLVTPVDLKILKTGWQSGYGNTITGSVADGINMLFAHLKEVNVGTGLVKAGSLIGKTGNTGGNYAPHLHQEMFMQADGEKIVMDKIIQASILRILKQFPDLSKSELAAIRDSAIETQRKINKAEKEQNKGISPSMAKELPFENKNLLAENFRLLLGSIINDRTTGGLSEGDSQRQVKTPRFFMPSAKIDDSEATYMARVPGVKDKPASKEEAAVADDWRKRAESYMESANNSAKKISALESKLKNSKSYGLGSEDVESLNKEIAESSNELENALKNYELLEKQIRNKFYRKDKRGNTSNLLSYVLTRSVSEVSAPASLDDPQQLGSIEKTYQDIIKNFSSQVNSRTQDLIENRSPNKLFEDVRLTDYLNSLFNNLIENNSERSRIRSEIRGNTSIRDEKMRSLETETDPETIKKIKTELNQISGVIDRQNMDLELNARKWLVINDAIIKVRENTGLVAQALSNSIGKNFDNFADQITGSFGAAFKAALNDPVDTRDVRTWWERFSDAYREAGSSALRDSLSNLASETLAIPQKMLFDNIKSMGANAFKSIENNLVSMMSGVDINTVTEYANNNEEKSRNGSQTIAEGVSNVTRDIKVAGDSVAGAMLEVAGEIKKVKDSIKTKDIPPEPIPINVDITNRDPNKKPNNGKDEPLNDNPPPKKSDDAEPKTPVGIAMANVKDIISTGAMAVSLFTTLSALSTKTLGKVDQKIKDVNDIFESNQNVRGVVVGEQNIGIGKLNEIFQPIAIDLRTLVQTLTNQFGAMPVSSGNAGIANNNLSVTVSGKIDLSLVESSGITDQITSIVQQQLIDTINKGSSSTLASG